MPRAAAALLLAVLALAGCGGDDEGGSASAAAAPAASAYGAAATAAVRDVEAGKATLLDVRTVAEHAEGHAPGAILLPLARIEDGARPDLPKGTKLAVYCRTGRRAEVAVRILRKAGFTDVTNIGGLRDWQAAGGAVER